MTGQCKPSELKPCPFCGADAVLRGDGAISCSKCPADMYAGPQAGNFDEQPMINTGLWNTRNPDTQLLAQRDELLAALHRAASGAGFQYMTFETREIIETAIANAEKGEE